MSIDGSALKGMRLEKVGRAGCVMLDRPKALNALTYEMFDALEAHYLEWSDDPHIYGIIMESTNSRAFSAGGDIRALYDWRKEGEIDKILGLYGSEYQHNYTLDRFTKPHIPLVNGIVMGGGVGVCLYGTHFVAGEGLRFAMPEVGIGFFPDIGATYFLPRLSGETGLYMALTGRSVDRADAFYLGIATHCVDAEHFPAVREAMTEGEPIDDVLAALHRDPGPSAIEALQPVISRLFAVASVEAVLEGLDAETGEFAEWAGDVAAEIRSKSPTSLKVAFRQMREGVTMSLNQALKLEYRLAHRFINGEELYEGVRAALVDKDQSPKWSPAELEAVTPQMIDAYFAPLETGELELVNQFKQPD